MCELHLGIEEGSMRWKGLKEEEADGDLVGATSSAWKEHPRMAWENMMKGGGVVILIKML
jgi:hypothetical protein